MAAAVLTCVGLALAVLALTTVVGGPAHAAGFRVVGTGDSILVLAYGVPLPGGVVNSSTWWIDVECGRDAYTAGMSGRASIASIWPLVLSRSVPGGWIIIQDNALGVSDFGWRSLMRRIVDETPNDRCLLGVLPVFRSDVNVVNAARPGAAGVDHGRGIQAAAVPGVRLLERLRCEPPGFCPRRSAPRQHGSGVAGAVDRRVRRPDPNAAIGAHRATRSRATSHGRGLRSGAPRMEGADVDRWMANHRLPRTTFHQWSRLDFLE